MNEQILYNEEDFNKWKNACSLNDWTDYDDISKYPERYPCWARTVVNNWDFQIEEAVYMYYDDVAALLERLQPNAPVQPTAHEEPE